MSINYGIFSTNIHFLDDFMESIERSTTEVEDIIRDAFYDNYSTFGNTLGLCGQRAKRMKSYANTGSYDYRVGHMVGVLEVYNKFHEYRFASEKIDSYLDSLGDKKDAALHIMNVLYGVYEKRGYFETVSCADVANSFDLGDREDVFKCLRMLMIYGAVDSIQTVVDDPECRLSTFGYRYWKFKLEKESAKKNEDSGVEQV